MASADQNNSGFNTTMVVTGVVAGALFLFALSLFLQGGFQTLQTRDQEAKAYGPVNEVVVDHRMEQQAILDEETRWLDEEKGILCMPIDDAVELFVANNATDAAH